ncbi:MAG TPA: isochorismate synthase [Dehalococcoidia bacterium]|nr:isochorismate synthase [Dehalococcoidia bacterium]
MSTSTEQPSVQQLVAVIENGRKRSAALARTILVSVTRPLGQLPALSVDAATECVLWQQPSRDATLFGVGRAATIEASGENRFGHVREGLARLLAEAVIDGPAPMAFAGFAFDPQQEGEERWRAFPDGLAVLPRLLFARRDATCSLTLNALVDADTDVGALAATLLADVNAFRSSAPVSESRGDAEMQQSGCAPQRLAWGSGEEAGRQFWLDNVTDLTGSIAAGEAEKVVLARRVDITSARPFSLDSALERLRQRYPDTTVFAVRQDETCFLGATPETLVRLDGRTVRADCLAGSYRRGTSEAEDLALGEALLADEKERREHAIVARALCDCLHGVCDDLRVPEAPSLRRMANVQHLYTPIEATTDGERHVLELVQRLHPTPATAGLPRERSICLIRRHEPFVRGWYAGPIGWLDTNGNGEFAVALRSALVRGNEASLYAGCGIVSGSDPAREYDESAIKLEAMLWALGQETPLHQGEGGLPKAQP